MRLRIKVILLAMLPLVAAAGLITFAQVQQERLLSARQAALVRQAYLESARGELRHFVALALSTVSPLYNTGRDDEEIKQQAIRRLAALDYGSDGYFFLYDFDGVNLMHPRQPELVGRNLSALRDENGERPIRRMIEKARGGGGFVEYSWNKPSSERPAPKLAYVTSLERWNWWFGTGLYIDDIDRVVAQLDRELKASTTATLTWISVVLFLGLLAILGGGTWLGLQELGRADARLTLLARQVVSSQEAERAHLARELHDGTNQTLVSVKLLTEAALARLSPGDAPARNALTRALARLQGALTEVRGLSHRLRPVMLDTLGLSAALQQLGEEMWALSDTRFAMRVEGEPFDLPDAIKTVFFRVTQEALTNIQKHARAQSVQVTLTFRDAAVHLTVRDDGRGFDAPAMLQHPSRGLGLGHMAERLASVGGRLALDSQPGQTLVHAEVPRSAIDRFAAAETQHPAPT